MKYIFKSFLMIMFLCLVASCEKSLEEVNIDPDNSPSAADANVLTAAQGYVGYIVEADLNRHSQLWSQYYTWGIGVSIGNQERFVAQPSDFDNYWFRAYTNALADLRFLTNSTDPAYTGAAKVLQAYLFQGLVDHFGDIPYSEAVSGAIVDGSILTPKFDDAATIYGSLIDLTDEAIRDLSSSTSSNMGADDLIYGGNLENWVRFANSLKLRLLMRLSETAPRASDVTELISSAKFIEGAGEVAAVPFDGISGDQNPMFARNSFGVGDFYFASNATLNTLIDLSDPRINFLYSPATTGTFMGQINGIDQGTIDNEDFTAPPTDWSGSSPNVYGAAMPVILISDWEVKFLRAEAAARYSTADNDATMLTQAIESSFSHLGATGVTTYISDLNYAGAANMDAKLNIIGTQKWISMNGTQEDEGWIEARRFDRPNNRLFTEGIWQNPPLSVLNDGEFPAAWLYPADERSFNPNAPAQRAITDKIFWDN